MIFWPKPSLLVRMAPALKRILSFGSVVLLCLTTSAVQLAQPEPALGLTVSVFQFELPATTSSSSKLEQPSILQTTSSSVTPRQTSLTHMRDFFSNVSQYFGTRYRFGGQTPAGFDCSGFVRFMFDKVFNMSLPRSSKEMSALGNKVSKNDLQPGDLVFFHSKSQRINHVGIFIGNDTFVHSSLTKGITEDQLKHEYYEKRFAGAVRLLEIPRSTFPAPQKQDTEKEFTKPS